MTIEVYKRSKDVDLELISLDDDFKPGDLCWLETPLNPTGEARYVDTLFQDDSRINNPNQGHQILCGQGQYNYSRVAGVSLKT